MRSLKPRLLLSFGSLLSVAACGGNSAGGGGHDAATFVPPFSTGDAAHPEAEGGKTADGAVTTDGSTKDGTAPHIEGGGPAPEGGSPVDGPKPQEDVGGASDSGGGTADAGSHDATITDGGEADGAVDGPVDGGSDGKANDAGGDDGTAPANDAANDASGDTAAPEDAGGSTCVCTDPPASTCKDSSTLEFYASAGTCDHGTCSYAPSFTNCTSGCANGSCNASGWTAMNSSTVDALYAAWGTSASDVWAVGNNGVAVHYDGNSWTVESPSGADYLTSVSGSGTNDVYATGNGQEVYHFDGTGWHSVPGLVPTSTYDLGISVLPNGSTWISGTQISPEDIEYPVLFPGTGSTLGAQQSDSSYGPRSFPTNLIAVFAITATDIWVGGNPISHSNGTTLTSVTGAPSATTIWAASATAIFAGTGGTTVAIGDGTNWTSSNTGTTGGTAGVWGTSSKRVFVATYGGTTGEVRAYNGIGWSNETLPANTPDLYGIYAAPSGEVFAVGANGTILKGP